MQARGHWYDITVVELIFVAKCDNVDDAGSATGQSDVTENHKGPKS